MEDGGEAFPNLVKKFCTSLSGANVIKLIESCAVENLLESDTNKPVAFKPSLSSHFESFISSTRFGSANELRTTQSEIRKLWIGEYGDYYLDISVDKIISEMNLGQALNLGYRGRRTISLKNLVIF